MQNTATTAEARLQKDKHTSSLLGFAKIAKDTVPLKKKKKSGHLHETVEDVHITVEGSVFAHENNPKHANLAKTLVPGDNITSWLANVKESFAQDGHDLALTISGMPLLALHPCSPTRASTKTTGTRILPLISIDVIVVLSVA